MFAITPVVLLILALAGGGAAHVGNSKAQDRNTEQAIEHVQAENTDPDQGSEQSDKLSASITVNGFPMYSFTSCAKAQTKATELRKQSPDLQIRSDCDDSYEPNSLAALDQ